MGKSAAAHAANGVHSASFKPASGHTLAPHSLFFSLSSSGDSAGLKLAIILALSKLAVLNLICFLLDSPIVINLP